jgi:hypothetical protein
MRSDLVGSRLIWAFLLSWLLAPEAWAEERFALLVGGDTGWAHDQPLHRAEADLERLGAVLVELGAFAPDRVQVLRDPDTATVRAQLRSLSTTVEAVGGQSLIFFYFLGHADERGLHLSGAPLSLEDLQGALRELPATRRVGVLDVCRSCVAGAQPEARAAVSELVVDEGGEPNLVMAVLQHGSDGAPSPQEHLPSGFTHHFISGLRGAAETDGDEAVSLSEVWRHALQSTRAERRHSEASPAPPPELARGHDVLMSQLSATRAQLVLPSGGAERYWVMDARERDVVAEARTRTGTSTFLALKPDRYLVKRIHRAQPEVVEIRLEPLQKVAAETLPYSLVLPGTDPAKQAPQSEGAGATDRWRRREALRLLATGRDGAALLLLEEVLARQPEDRQALRIRARALVRRAESEGRRGRAHQEQEALRAALEAEPWLAEDPDFALEYQRLQAWEAAKERAVVIQDARDTADSQNPRRGLRWVKGWVLMSSRGFVAPMRMYFLNEHFYLYGALDFVAGQAVDVGFRIVPGNGPYSGMLGMGIHMPVLGRPLVNRDPEPGSVSVWERAFGRTAHLDWGVQLIFDEVGLEMGLSAAFYLGDPGGDQPEFFNHVVPFFDFSVWFLPPK